MRIIPKENLFILSKLPAFMKSKAQTGDKVLVKLKIKIEKENKEEEGVLLESHEPGVLLLKLKNGYNIGLKKRDVKSMKILSKGKEEKEQEQKIKGSGKSQGRIDIIMTGGTISSSLDVKTGGVKWLTKPGEFFKIYPEIFGIADVRILNPFMKSSENMEFSDWAKIAKLVSKSLNDKNCKGVIVTHGTDFLHYTSSALSFFLKNLNKPVVLTYSQRSIDRGSSDARLNLLCAAHAALSDIAEVMLVGHANLNDDFCYALLGTKVRKMHSSRRDTFRAINTKPLAKIWPDGRIEKILESKKRVQGKEKAKNKTEADAVFEDKVALVKFYPGQSPDILDYYLKKGYKGIVIEMSGLGHVITEGNKSWISILKKLIENNVVVCAAAQTIYGRLDPFVYSPGRELEKLGVIYLEDMLPETAFVKLGYVLGKAKEKTRTGNKKRIKELMLENIAGEFNKKLGKEFLE